MFFADIHTHILWGVDDGAESADKMYQMLDAAYAAGTRVLWLTPHYHPGYFGENREKSEEIFEQLLSCPDRYPQMELYLANELRWSPNCDEWLDLGLCRSLDDAGSVLVDFSETETRTRIISGLEQMLSAGYRPILAHVERYRHLRNRWRDLARLKDQGVRFQITAGALSGGFGVKICWCARALIGRDLTDFVASDAHDMDHRPPEMCGAYQWICRKKGAEYAKALCYDNALTLLRKRKE